MRRLAVPAVIVVSLAIQAGDAHSALSKDRAKDQRASTASLREDVYKMSKTLCSAFPPGKIAREYHARSRDWSDIAWAYARASYRPGLRPIAAAGCLAGLRAYAKRHRLVAHAASISRSFYFAVDNMALDLDGLITRAFRGESVRPEIHRLRRRVAKRHARWILAGHRPSKGANLIQSAASEADVAVRQRDQRKLVIARRYLTQGRRQLAQELR